MTIPALPTDNLYKFLALSGVVLIIISIVSFASYILHVDEATQLLTARRLALGQDLSFSKVAGDVKLLQQIEKENLMLSRDVEILVKQHKRFSEAGLFGVGLCFVSGTIMARVGFSRWYNRVQIYQDIILKDQADEVKRRDEERLKASNKTQTTVIAQEQPKGEN